MPKSKELGLPASPWAIPILQALSVRAAPALLLLEKSDMNLEICLAQQNRDFISQMAKALEKGLYPRSEDPGFYALYYKLVIRHFD